MALTTIKCAWCKNKAQKEVGAVTRSKSLGRPIYCNRECAGLGRRNNKTKAQKVAEKKVYDAEYRRKNIKFLTASKALYFKKTYDPVKAAIERKKRMPKHVEYCRVPEYRAKKKIYDRKHRAEKFFGPFAEVAMLTWDLNKTIKEKMTNAEIKWENQTACKAQFREREGKQENRGRPRQRARRDRHSATVG